MGYYTEEGTYLDFTFQVAQFVYKQAMYNKFCPK